MVNHSKTPADSAIMSRVKAHFNEKNVMREIEVPEWADDEGNPTLIYHTPMTLHQRQYVDQQSKNNFERLVMVVITKSLDKDGKKLFSLADKHGLMRAADSDVVSNIATQIVGGDEEVDVAEGN